MPSTGAGETRPERIDEAGDKRAVAGKFLFRREMGTSRTRLANDDRPLGRIDRYAACVGNEAQTDLPPAGQLDVDLREKLRVEQGTVLHAMTAIDPEAHAQGVEAVLRARVPHARELKRVAHTLHADRRPAAALELVIEKAEIERRIVRDQRRILEEVEQLLGALGEARLVRKEDCGE